MACNVARGMKWPALRMANGASEVEMSGEGPGAGSDFLGKLSDIFARQVFQPMFQRAPAAPGDVRQLIAEIRRQLDVLDEVIAIAEPGRRDGSAVAAMLDTAAAGLPPAADDLDDIGRNQRSRVRELVLLEAMARESRPYSLQQLLAALGQRGFGDTSGAVVSQLHRLKKLGLINQPANGMYEITLDGLGHLRKLRTSFGALVGEPR